MEQVESCQRCIVGHRRSYPWTSCLRVALAPMSCDGIWRGSPTLGPPPRPSLLLAMLPSLLGCVYLILTVVLAVHVVYRQLRKRAGRNPKGLPLPPGPQRWLPIGNLFDWLAGINLDTLDSWHRQYGTRLTQRSYNPVIQSTSAMCRACSTHRSIWPADHCSGISCRNLRVVRSTFYKLLRSASYGHAKRAVCSRILCGWA